MVGCRTHISTTLGDNVKTAASICTVILREWKFGTLTMRVINTWYYQPILLWPFWLVYDAFCDFNFALPWLLRLSILSQVYWIPGNFFCKMFSCTFSKIRFLFHDDLYVFLIKKTSVYCMYTIYIFSLSCLFVLFMVFLINKDS